MRSRSILHTALNRSSKGRHAREKLLQHIAVAYLWGDEPIEGDDSLMNAILVNADPGDIHEFIRFFWGVQGDRITPPQVDRIFGFWRACMQHLDEREEAHIKVLSDLGLLAAFLRNIDPEQEQWLQRIAPYIGVNHNRDFFLEYLERLADTNPREVGEITLAVAKSDKPYFDFEKRYESIIQKLLAAEYYDLARQICNQPGLMDIPRISELYASFRDQKGH